MANFIFQSDVDEKYIWRNKMGMLLHAQLHYNCPWTVVYKPVYRIVKRIYSHMELHTRIVERYVRRDTVDFIRQREAWRIMLRGVQSCSDSEVCESTQ